VNSRPLGYCASQVDSPNIGTREQNLLSLSYGNIVRKDIAGSDGLLPESFETYNVVEPGDTVLRLTDLQNDQRSLRVGFVQERGIITSAYVTLRPQHDVDPRFFSYVLKSMDFRKDFYALGAGVRQSLKFDELKRVQIHLPAFAKQRAIADYLDTETTRIDALIEKKRRMVAVLHERFGVALATIFAAVDAPRRKLTAVAHVSLGRQRNPASDSGPDMVPYLRAANVKDGFLDLSDVKQMNFAPREQRIFALKPGDVLVTEGAGSLAAVGASAPFHGELQSPVCFQNTLIRLRARQGVRADYLAWWTRFAYRTGMLADLAGGANIFHIGAERMQTLALPLPLEGVQGEVVDRLSRAETLQLSVSHHLERQIELLRERRQALITAAVTGEIEVPGVAA